MWRWRRCCNRKACSGRSPRWRGYWSARCGTTRCRAGLCGGGSRGGFLGSRLLGWSSGFGVERCCNRPYRLRMNEEQRKLATELRGKPSDQIADWLLQHYPKGGEAIVLLEHVTLRKRDYRRLAARYLAGRSHSHNRAYRLFAQHLGLSGLIRILGETQNREARDADLLAYHIKPLLRLAQNEQELREAIDFMEELALS